MDPTKGVKGDSMKKVAVLFARAVSAMVQRGEDLKTLNHYDTIVISEHCWNQLDELAGTRLKVKLQSKCLLYFDHWGKSSYRTNHWGFTPWQLGPGDMGQPVVKFNGKTYAHAMTTKMMERITLMVGKAFMRCPFSRAAGVFMDDWGFNRRHWTPKAYTPEGKRLRDQVWDFDDGHPRWWDRDLNESKAWNESRMAILEKGVHAFLALRGKRVMLNASRLERAKVKKSGIFYEGLGPHGWIDLEDIEEDVREGDVLWLKCLDENGKMDPKCLPVWEDIKAIAVEIGCGFGRSFFQTPQDTVGGGSVHSNTEDPTGPDWGVNDAR